MKSIVFSKGPLYSPPLSDMMHFNLLPVSLSTLAWNSLKASSTFQLGEELLVSKGVQPLLTHMPKPLVPQING
uniref:Uncharacterized protein n=1 Tax=Arundo donax TaxID=35708 RepID=A0A0A8ZUY7_ARUDO